MQKKKKIILILILLAGALARLYQIGKIFFILDENYTLKNCLRTLPSLIQYWFSEGHFPTYFIMMHYWMKIFGSTEFAIRFPSLIFGILSIYVIYLIGKKLFDEKTGLLAGFLLAISTLNIYYSQIARPYSMVLFFSLMSFMFLYDALERNTRLRWGAYVFFTVFALLLNASTLPIIICQMVFIKLARLKFKKVIDTRKMVISFIIIFLVYLPFLLKLAVSSFNGTGIMPLQWVNFPSITTIIDTFSLFGNMIYKGGTCHVPDVPDLFRNTAHAGIDFQLPKGNLHILTAIFGIILFLLCMRGIFSLLKSNEKKDHIKGIYLSIWLGGPIVLLFVFSQLVSPVFGPVRYVLYVSPVYYLLISRGIISGGMDFFKKKIRLSMVIFIIIFSFISLREYHSSLYHEDAASPWGKVAAYLKKNNKINDTMVLSFHNAAGSFDVLFNSVNSLYLDLPVRGVWAKELFKESNEGEMAVKVVTGQGIPQDKKQNINNMVQLIGVTEIQELDNSQFWFVDWNTDTNRKMVRLFKNKYDLIEEKEFGEVIVSRFKRKK